MATVAVRYAEAPVEERISRLEANVEHIQTDVSEIRIDIREMRQDIRRLDDKIDGVDRRLSGKIDEVKDSVVVLRLGMEKALGSLKVWALMLYFALAATLLGVMARGFGWL